MRVEIEANLLPCPFCGQPGAIERIGETGQYYPRCIGGSGKFCLMARPLDPEKDGFIHIEDAVEVWNHRAKAPVNALGDNLSLVRAAEHYRRSQNEK